MNSENGVTMKQKIMDKRKTMIIAIVVVIVGVILAVVIPRVIAYNGYVHTVESANIAVVEYNAVVAEYNAVAERIVAANAELNTSLVAAQESAEYEDTAYEEEKRESLCECIENVKGEQLPNPKIYDDVENVIVDTKLRTASKKKIDEATNLVASSTTDMLAQTDEIKSETVSLVVPDYSAFIDQLAIVKKELDDSFAIYRQIICPTEAWVIERLKRVGAVANVAAVTEDNDPNGNLNKQGGYTATVYFVTDLLGTENMTGDAVIDIGTDGGGAIEVYPLIDDVERRCNYLSAFDGGMFASGSHTILGTMLIRTSNDLKASQQQELTDEIIAAMTVLD